MTSKVELTGTKPITFVVATNNREILEKNLLASPCLRNPHAHQIILQENFRSAATAYNDGIDNSLNDLIVFCHQDMFFPPNWISQLESTIQRLEQKDSDWGVLGCFGVTRDGQKHGYVYSSGLGIIGQHSEPVEVQTLDEIVLVFKKSSGLRFDSALRHFHLYGTDICLRAATLGRKNYAVSVFCIHNTYQAFNLPKEFFECCDHIRRTWSRSLPVQTPCIRISKSNIPVYVRRLRQMYFKHLRRKEQTVLRETDVSRLFEEVADSAHTSA